MSAVDASAIEPIEDLVEQAGVAVARAVLAEMGGSYGRRVAVLAGKGLNGADGRVAAERLTQRGVRTTVVEASAAIDRLPAVGGHSLDLVVDAAYGTGLGRGFEAPIVDAPVVAVDLPSGLDGLTGEALGRPLTATRTVTFAALKPGLLFGNGPALSGRIEVVDLALDVSHASSHLVEDRDIPDLVPSRSANAHKWQSACWVLAGSPGMEGAAGLAATAALRGGAGYVRLTTPAGTDGIQSAGVPVEVVCDRTSGPVDPVEAARYASFVVGPGLGTGPLVPEVVQGVLSAARATDRPVVIDGDGLTAIAKGRVTGNDWPSVGAVLTPHDGEFSRLAGQPPGPDRMAAARGLAARTGAVILLKGPTTVVAAPDGRVLLTATGNAHLATAGSGDVLSGILGAVLARGAKPFEAAAGAAHIHGRLATSPGLYRRPPEILPSPGMTAADLAARLVSVMERLGIDRETASSTDQVKGAS